MIKTIIGTQDFIESLRGKRASFLLALCNTKTADIDGITQAGIPGHIHLTPALDAEFICVGQVRSMPHIAQTPKGVPTPALISRAVHCLAPFDSIELFDLGLWQKPQVEYFLLHNLGFCPSQSIDQGAQIDAIDVFEKALEYGQNFQSTSDYLILGESTPGGTTTASAVAQALGYEVKGKFSSSFKSAPDDIKHSTIQKALRNISLDDEFFSVLSKVGDNMLIFSAGFILGLNNKIPLILAGGTQMASVLLIVNRVLQEMNGKFESSNLALCTTKWIYEDSSSDIQGLLEMLDFPINAYYADFDFSLSSHPALKLYDNAEAKEGAGAGACLVYGYLNGLSQKQLTQKIEEFVQ